ncbi:Thiamine biosynthesis lipoprotein ApbE precursor [uncultured Roseburia sp.]|uniref:FAD:protein FMN transferase n=1 Tax=Brotonthovivens ammoniilytica TaxID=2981725 RepID=A0ABT2TJZ5_9FIRM|nr:FAD:protein FMN transferase [Brotonthovivens ammoniilytica]MCU6762548.1 FAD:protein FMN transferase [Brotonthovivens ammoniilytica]SCI75309.1 Thiamine biosynthesis lipoprotein ApbE precursor [uncultured Roseburia sp.]
MKKIIVYIVVSAAVISMCLGAAGCSTSTNVLAAQQSSENADSTEKDEASGEVLSASRDIFAMDTYMTVEAYGDHCQEAVDQAEEEILRLDQMLSTGSISSEISKLNQDGYGTVSRDTFYLIQRSLELYQETDGAFNIAVYPVMRAWGFTDQNYKVPDETELKKLISDMDLTGVVLDEKTYRVQLANDEMEIDLGGIAKGYTSSRIMDIFKSCKVESGMVSLGGNVQLYGAKADGSSWRVAIEDPNNLSGYAGILEAKNRAVITSGGYERYFEQDGKEYHHIIDPKTGYPADNGLKSVTIVSADGTLADGLSTSLFIMGKDRALEFWQAHSEEFDAVLIMEDGSIYITEGIENDFQTEQKSVIVRKEDSDE